MKVNTWTVNDEENMRDMLNRGVDCIISNYPDLQNAYGSDTAAAFRHFLRYGMNVTVEIITARREGCMTVPASAVSGSTVQVLENGSPADRTVETGLTGSGVTEILSGLSPEDQVILPGS